MKVILNKDLAPLGEEGDVKDVAKGYARNYLFPRKIALPYTENTIKLFESRREEIEARKETKRQDALGLKEKLESLELTITMPAGANGKLYGAVTSQTVADELSKQGFQIERKRIELPGTNFKSVGKYKAVIKLYESAAAEINITVMGQELKTETSHGPVRGRGRFEGRGRTGSHGPETQAAETTPAADTQAPAEGQVSAELQTPAEDQPAAENQTPAVQEDTTTAENPPVEETVPQAGDTEASAPVEDSAGGEDAAAPETAAAQE
jgi:large subunit ribosomal protein L9